MSEVGFFPLDVRNREIWINAPHGGSPSKKAFDENREHQAKTQKPPAAKNKSTFSVQMLALESKTSFKLVFSDEKWEIAWGGLLQKSPRNCAPHH